MAGRDEGSGRPGRWLRCATLLVLAVGAVLTWGACRQPAMPIGGTHLEATVDEVLANPQRYSGHMVTVEGEVAQVVSERVIALRGASARREMLAVVSNQSLRAVDFVRAGDRLTIVGKVDSLTREQVKAAEEQLGVDLDEEQLLTLAGQGPFIVARQVSK